MPDIEVERELYKTVEINLERQSMFFDFAIKFVANHPDTKPTFTVDDEILESFHQFLKENDFTYTSALQSSLDEMRETITEQEREEQFADAMASLESLVEEEKMADLAKYNSYVRRAIKREIVRAIAGERGVYENIILLSDKTIKEAVRVLSSPKEYSRLINEGKKKAEL